MTEELREKQQTEEASQTSSPKGMQPQKDVIATEKSHESQTGKEPVQFLSCSNSCPTEIQESGSHITTTLNRDTKIPLSQ